jgi:poly(3-hydroxyalkanoate) synthetase
VEDYLGGCVQHILRAHGVGSLNLLGICEGGVLTICYAALHPAHFLRMEQWLADRPHHPGEAGRDFFIGMYQRNELVEGKLTIGGQPVKLAALTMPVLNIFALEDHIIPPPCSQALGKLVGTKDYSELALSGGHVGVFVSGKSQGIVGSQVVKWLEARSRAAAKKPAKTAAGKPPKPAAAKKAARPISRKPTARA